jgi:PAS domain S-box-containing protein
MTDATKRLHLLVVEDDEADRLAVRRCIHQCGLPATADFATNGTEALEQLTSASYACVLLDYYIPGVEGLTLFRKIREVAPDIPILMFTGRGDEDIAVELMKSGAMDYLPKASLTPERLAAGLRHAMELAHAAGLRRAAEEDLRRQEARFRTLANAIPQLAWTADPSGLRDWFNDRWLDYTGSTLAEMRGFGWQSVHHPDHLERVRESLAAAFASGDTWEETFPLRRADGQYRWFLTRALPVHDDNEKIHGWVGTNTEISELMEARLEAEAAVQARDLLIATVTHDLKNPLTVVAGYAHRLTRELAAGITSPRDTLAEYAREIEDSTRRMGALIADLLEMSLSATGEMELVLEPTDLGRMARSVVETQQRTNRTHQLRIDVGEDKIIGEWDGPRLERVLTNLVSNAVKYSPGGGTVVIELRSEGSEAVVRVIDEGIGIPAGDVPHIFDRFRRATNVSGTISGAGLGLAIAHDIVTRHGGSISVESVEGRGSAFTVRLPLDPLGQPRMAE